MALEVAGIGRLNRRVLFCMTRWPVFLLRVQISLCTHTHTHTVYIYRLVFWEVTVSVILIKKSLHEHVSYSEQFPR